MLAALLIVFREVFEAGIIVGVALAATEGVRGRGLWISGGVLAGVAASGLVALFADVIASQFDGSGQEVFNAAVLGVAVAMLVWTGVWMASHGREMAAQMKAVGRDVKEGRKPLAALAVVVAMATLREGVEIVLFLYGLAATGADSAAAVALGGALGLAGGALVSFALYRGLVAIPMKRLFQVITAMIALLAAGLAAQAVGILQDAGFIQSLADPVWNTSFLLADDSALGRVLRTLIGYRAQPTGMQVVGYVATLAAIAALTFAVNRSASARRAQAAATSRAA